MLISGGGHGPVSADLELVVGGRPVRFPAVWLRDNCPCPDCLAPGTGQKLNDITDIPNGLAITRTEDAGESVLVTFAPDQHRSAFPRSWLEEHALDGERDGDGRTEDDKELWLPADLDGLPAMSWPSYLAGGKAEALEAVLRLGFVLLSGVSAEPGRVLEVAASFGYVRETNYGRLFDVRVEPPQATWPSPAGRSGRTPTTRTATRCRPCSCCTACARRAGGWGGGGDTGLVDGFAAAAELRATDAGSFGTLAKTPVSFGYVDKETELRASLPLIQLSPSGRVRGVRFNNRSMRPLRRPYAEVTAFYAAYRRWAELLAQPGRQLNLRLAPGDCLVFDNTRVLHARTAFSMSPGSAGAAPAGLLRRPGRPGQHPGRARQREESR